MSLPHAFLNSVEQIFRTLPVHCVLGGHITVGKGCHINVFRFTTVTAKHLETIGMGCKIRNCGIPRKVDHREILL